VEAHLLEKESSKTNNSLFRRLAKKRCRSAGKVWKLAGQLFRW
jgi:hypothetical protein